MYTLNLLENYEAIALLSLFLITISVGSTATIISRASVHRQ